MRNAIMTDFLRLGIISGFLFGQSCIIFSQKVISNDWYSLFELFQAKKFTNDPKKDLVFDAIDKYSLAKTPEDCFLLLKFYHDKQDRKKINKYASVIKQNPNTPNFLLEDSLVRSVRVKFKSKNATKKINLDAVNKINITCGWDQALRYHFYRKVVSSCIDDVMIRYNDSLTTLSLNELIISYQEDLFDVKSLGKSTQEKLLLVLGHSFGQFPMFKDSVKAICFKALKMGYLDAINYTELFTFSERSGYDFYGLIYQNKATRNWEIGKQYGLLYNIENIDNRRESIGLYPLFFDLKKYGISFPEGYHFNEKVYWDKKEAEIRK